MKKFLYAALVLAISCKQQSVTNFEVDGTVKNAPAKTIYLEQTSFGNMQPVIVDSAQLSSDGSFKLETRANEESVYNLRLDQDMYPFVSFINDSKQITINADFNNQDELYTVKGSPASEALRTYLNTTGSKMRDIYNTDQLLDSAHRTNMTDSLINAYTAQREAAAKELKQYTADFINKSKSPALTLFALGSYLSVAGNPSFKLESFSQEEINDIINKTAAAHPDNKAIASIKSSLQQQATTPASAAAGSWLNKPAPDFTLPDVDGKPVSLSSFKGKYVLVDFWASWCGPCRMENPNVVQAYQQFKDKNFTILGVSLDQKKEPWLKAIKDDNLAWTQVSDLKFWDSQVVNLYGFEGIPFNVLVDPNGIVIGEGLRGAELENKLKEVLQ